MVKVLYIVTAVNNYYQNRHIKKKENEMCCCHHELHNRGLLSPFYLNYYQHAFNTLIICSHVQYIIVSCFLLFHNSMQNPYQHHYTLGFESLTEFDNQFCGSPIQFCPQVSLTHNTSTNPYYP